MKFTEVLNISINDDEGMQFDSPSKGIPTLKDHLRKDGFAFGADRIVIEGTDTISDLVEVDIIGTDFKGLRGSIENFLKGKKIKMIENFSREEEITNAILHGIGLGVAVAVLVLLIVFANINGSVWHTVGFSIYGSMLCLMYLSSTLFHAFPRGRYKNFFEICDHASIYLLIAGTYTPVTFTIIKGGLGWTIFGIVWGLAAAGVVFKVFWVKRFVFASTMIYIVMGWLIVMGVVPIVKEMPTISLVFLMTGGILYTAGTIFYMFRWFKYHHAVWHILVLFASLCHFFTMLFLIA